MRPDFSPQQEVAEIKKDSRHLYRMKTAWDIRKAGCRTFQSVMKLVMYVLPWRVPQVMQGAGAVKRLPALVKRRGFSKALIVTGRTLRKRYLLDGLLEAMKETGLDYEIYEGVGPNPTDENVEAGVAVFRNSRCDCMIAFGGGSPMDCAKAIGARIARPKKQTAQLQGVFRVIRPIPVIFAVPTTAGTGSETTIAAVITESATHHKASMNDLCLMPRFAVLDPELTVGLPPKVTAATGMDALCHAVEAYTNNTYNSSVEKQMCKKAVRLIHENLLRAYSDGSDLEARQNMQHAAFMAGRAFTRGCVGYVHAVGHTLSGLYGTPHGLAMAILLPHVMRAFGKAVWKRLAELSDICHLTEETESEQTKAEAFIQWIEELKEKMEIPEYPDMIREEDIEQIAKWAEKEANPLYPVPVVWSRKDLKQFLHSLSGSASPEENSGKEQKDE